VCCKIYDFSVDEVVYDEVELVIANPIVAPEISGVLKSWELSHDGRVLAGAAWIKDRKNRNGLMHHTLEIVDKDTTYKCPTVTAERWIDFLVELSGKIIR
jgi:hypothetical protein